MVTTDLMNELRHFEAHNLRRHECYYGIAIVGLGRGSKQLGQQAKCSVAVSQVESRARYETRAHRWVTSPTSHGLVYQI